MGTKRTSACLLVLLSVLSGMALLAVGLHPAHGNPFTGQSYQYNVSGTLISASGFRTFGSAPTLFAGPGPSWSLSEGTDTTGLGPNQVRLWFSISDQSPQAGSGSGALGAARLSLDVDGLSLPPGATLLPETARAVYDYADNLNPGTVPVDAGSAFGPGASMTFLVSSGGFDPINHAAGEEWPVETTFEIVVDNVPEPVTIALFATGALGIVSASFRKLRQKA